MSGVLINPYAFGGGGGDPGPPPPVPKPEIFGMGDSGAWYDPSDLSTLFQDTSATTPVTAFGQLVHRINDALGGSLALSRNAAGDEPRYHGDTLKPDGNDFLKAGTSFGNPTAVTLAFVMETSGTTTDLQNIIGLQQATGARYNLTVRQDFTSPNVILRAAVKYTGGGQANLDYAAPTAQKRIYKVTLTFNNGVTRLYTDGAQRATHTGAAGALGGDSNMLAMFADITDIRHFSGVIIGALIIDRELDSTDRAAVDAYWDAKAAESYPVRLSNGATEVTLNTHHTFIQGIEVDGTTAYVTASGPSTEAIYKHNRSSSWAVTDSETLANISSGNFTATSFGDVKLYDSKLFIACGQYTDGGNAIVAEVATSDLSYIAHHDLTSDCATGLNLVLRKNGIWYVGETAVGVGTVNPAVRMFDASWNYLGIAWQSTGDSRVDFNGGVFVGDFLVAGTHGPELAVFKLNPNGTLTRRANIGLLTETQGIAVVGGELFVAHRPSGGSVVYAYDYALA